MFASTSCPRAWETERTLVAIGLSGNHCIGAAKDPEEWPCFVASVVEQRSQDATGKFMKRCSLKYHLDLKIVLRSRLASVLAFAVCQHQGALQMSSVAFVPGGISQRAGRHAARETLVCAKRH